MAYKILVVAGDGIGPDVVAEGLKVLDVVARRYGHTFDFTEDLVGAAAMDVHGVPIREETLQKARQSDAVLLGAVGDPRYDDPRATQRPEDGALALRKGLDVFGNIRPVKLFDPIVHTSPLKPEIVRGTDIVFLRELTAGTYFGQPKKIYEVDGQQAAVDTCSYTQHEIERVARLGFRLARARRKKLTSVDKLNVMATGRLWREIVTRIGQTEFPDVALEHILADNCAMAILRRPRDFDVILADNLFGDILTDEASMLAGSMGMLPSASVNETKLGLYEPIHGSAPKYKGQNKVNPLATILTVAMMLRWSFDLTREADLIEQAVARALEQGYRTYDIAQPGDTVVGTREMGDAVVAALKELI